MLQLGVVLVALGLLSILFEPKWLPRFVRRGLPHTGYIVLGFTAIADHVTVGHIDAQLAMTPDSSLGILAPVLLKVNPRTLATLLPPEFVGTTRMLDVALQLALVVVGGAITVAFIRPEWLRPITRSVTRVGLALVVLLAAWSTGIDSRTLGVVRERVRADGHAPLRSVADLIGALPGEYHRSLYALLLIGGAMLCVLGVWRAVLAFRRAHRRARQWNAA